MNPDLRASARDLVPAISDAAVAQLIAYRDLLAASAREFNLTGVSVRDPEAIERRHIGEALAFGALLASWRLLEDGAKVLDVGSGAGLPGLPLKIAWPSLHVTLLEATGKKCRFLESVVARLRLEGIDVVEGRAEELAHDSRHRATYDLVVARAVAPLPVLLEYCLPFLRVGGTLAASKGSAAQSELAASQKALAELGGAVEAVLPFEPPGLPPQTVILVRKVAQTPEPYPRRSGIPSKRPLV